MQTPGGKTVKVNVTPNAKAQQQQTIEQIQGVQPPQAPTAPPQTYMGTPSYGYLPPGQADTPSQGPQGYSSLFGPPPGYQGTRPPIDPQAEKLMGQNLPYASVYTGQKPITPQEIFDKRMQMINEYNVPYNERMDRARRQDKRSGARRFFERILAQDPFYDEKVAGNIAAYDQQMALQVLNMGQQALLQKAQDDAILRTNNAKILEAKLNENPLLRQNDAFMTDLGITMGIPKDEIPTWLETQKDKEGRYTFLTDPIQAQKDAIKRQAEILSETTGITLQQATIAVHDPELKRQVLSSAQKRAELDLINAYKSKDANQIAAAERHFQRVKFLMSDTTGVVLEERLKKLERTKDQWWGIKSPDGQEIGKKMWLDLWKASWLDYYGLRGSSAEQKDPMELYYEMTKKKEEATQAIMKTQQMKRDLPKFKDELIMQTHSTWGAAKSEEEKMLHYTTRDKILGEMSTNKITKENVPQAEAYRMMIIEALGPEIMQRLGMRLEMDEAAYIADEIDRAQRMGRTIDQNRLVLYITNLRKNKEAAKNPRK